jgi:hypothetical protein
MEQISVLEGIYMCNYIMCIIYIEEYVYYIYILCERN